MKFSTILLGHVSDGDLHTKLKDVEYSTNLREIITVGDMLRAENLKGGEVRDSWGNVDTDGALIRNHI